MITIRGTLLVYAALFVGGVLAAAVWLESQHAANLNQAGIDSDSISPYGAIALAAAALAAALIFATRLAAAFREPIDALIERVRRIERLDLAPAVRMKSGVREIQQLSDSMEAMREVLRGEFSERQRNEDEYRYFIENANDVIWATDIDGKFTFVNQAMERIYGFAPEESLRMTVGDLSVDDEHGKREMEGLARIMAGESLTAFEAEHKGKDGETISVLINAVPKRDEQGKIIGATGVATDVTDLKEAEKMLARSLFREAGHSQELEHEVARRTRELEETLDELRGAQDKMVHQEKLASLGSLTAGIAHEIRNPLNFVNNFSELNCELTKELEEAIEAAKENLPPDARQKLTGLVEDIRQNAAKVFEHGRQADEIMKGMLAHSRGAPGVFEHKDLNALVDEHVKLAYHGMRATDMTFNVTIEADYDDSLEPISVVSPDIGRVILNMANNAFFAVHTRKQSAPGGYEPTLNVSTKDQGDTVEIRVRDNGTGMTDEVRNNVFDPFFTTKEAGIGTGLGLSISFDIIVQGHKGSLHVESEPDVFTEFVITIPKNAGPAAE